MDNTEEKIEYEETDPPQVPKKPYVPEQKPVIAAMEKYEIKVPLVYLTFEKEAEDNWGEV